MLSPSALTCFLYAKSWMNESGCVFEWRPPTLTDGKKNILIRRLHTGDRTSKVGSPGQSEGHGGNGKVSGCTAVGLKYLRKGKQWKYHPTTDWFMEHGPRMTSQLMIRYLSAWLNGSDGKFGNELSEQEEIRYKKTR